MEMSVQRLTLDLRQTDSGKCLSTKRGNTAVRLKVNLTNGGCPYWIDEGVSAVFTAQKSDGAILFNACSIEENTVIYDFTGQTVNVEGETVCEIRLYSGDELVLTSPSFTLLVDDTVYEDGAILDSSDEVTALTELMAAGTALVNDLNAAEERIKLIQDTAVDAQNRAETAAEEAADAALESATSASAAQAAAEEAQAARRDLAGKLPAPSTARVGNLLRIKAVNADGTFEVEAVRTLEGLGCNTLTLIDSNDGSGDSGTRIEPEGTAEAPVLVLYGLNGDEPVRISNVAKAEADRDVPTLGQVRELVGEAGGGTAGDALGAVVFPSTAANNSTALLTAITAAAALGVGVRIPAGTYVFTEPITLPDGVTVELTGAGDAFANSMNREQIGTEYHAKGYDGDVRTLNALQRASVAALEKVAEALGVQIYLFESKVDENGVRQGENGWYNTKTGDIGIDIHAGTARP